MLPEKPEPANVVHDRLAHNRSKDPMEVVLREASDHSQSMGRQLVIEMCLHVSKHI